MELMTHFTMESITFQLDALRLAGLCSCSPGDQVITDPQAWPEDTHCLTPDKPVLVMLHGWQDNAASFAPLFEPLADHFHLLAIDWPGHGLSQARPDGNFYHFVDYVDDLAQLLSLLPVSRVHLLGHSLGALVSTCYAAAFPERVASMILIEGLGPLSESPEHAATRLRDGILSRERYRKRASVRRGMTSFDQAVTLRCEVNALTPEQVIPLVERATYCQDSRWYWRHDPRLRCDSLYRMADGHSLAMRAAVSCPVLSIIGEQGYQSLQLTSEQQQQWQNLSQTRVSGGHHCHLESPRATVERIVSFASKFKTLV
ncbi:alpha/beta fold hydrolase [Photobacterium ganghwense]|uniref:alpha/beta fold hydrolase n=1 Tax=Photobacterium ganghwense TaxID=320778 RepID=UPI0020C56A8B|nr:alpha/beta hydrolase [Photobacterium ganghwense]